MNLPTFVFTRVDYGQSRGNRHLDLIEAEVIVTRPWVLAGIPRQVMQVVTPILNKTQCI